MPSRAAKFLVRSLLDCEPVIFESEDSCEEPQVPDEVYAGLGEPRTLDYETAQTANYFWHKKIKRDNGMPLIVRRNGRTRIWKRRPGAFKIPVKYGFYDCFYITDADAENWYVGYPQQWKEPRNK